MTKLSKDAPEFHFIDKFNNTYRYLYLCKLFLGAIRPSVQQEVDGDVLDLNIQWQILRVYEDENMI